MKKNLKKIIIGLVFAVAACLLVIILIKANKPEKIKVGMSGEEVISILNKGKYEYTERDDDFGLHIIEVKKAAIKKINGSTEIRIDSLKDRVQYIKFYPDVDGYNDTSKLITNIYNYLTKLYGEPASNGFESKESVSKLWSEADKTNIVFTYPVEEGEEIYILWILRGDIES